MAGLRSSSVSGVLLAAALSGPCLTAGCSHDGDVEIPWQFAGPSPDGESAQEGCGQHGVDSVFVTGSSDKGDGASFLAVCTAGALRRTVPAATWSFTLQPLDVHGNNVQPADVPDGMTYPMPVSEGAVTQFPPISIVPRAACADGIDNDRDGRVDLTDPDCGGDPTWNDEATPKQP
jgi:hypothetical protein